MLCNECLRDPEGSLQMQEGPAQPGPSGAAAASPKSPARGRRVQDGLCSSARELSRCQGAVRVPGSGAMGVTQQPVPVSSAGVELSELPPVRPLYTTPAQDGVCSWKLSGPLINNHISQICHLAGAVWGMGLALAVRPCCPTEPPPSRAFPTCCSSALWLDRGPVGTQEER